MSIDDAPISTRSPYGADDLQFCDEDIQEAFRNTTTFIGVASMVQLAREIRKLREVLEARTDSKADDFPLDTRGCYGYGGWGKW